MCEKINSSRLMFFLAEEMYLSVLVAHLVIHCRVIKNDIVHEYVHHAIII